MEELGQHQLVANEGKSAEIRLKGSSAVGESRRDPGRLHPAVDARRRAIRQRWVEIGEPRIMVVNGNQAQVKVTSPKGNVYHIVIRPRRM